MLYQVLWNSLPQTLMVINDLLMDIACRSHSSKRYVNKKKCYMSDILGNKHFRDLTNIASLTNSSRSRKLTTLWNIRLTCSWKNLCTED